jgi:hypothetical protein
VEKQTRYTSQRRQGFLHFGHYINGHSGFNFYGSVLSNEMPFYMDQ